MSIWDYIYECYGPNGVAIIIEVLSDNKNRTFPEIKSIMSKNGGNIGEQGCVNWMIEKKVIHGGMSPKVDACLHCVKNGVESAQIINGTEPHSVIAELFTDQGIGTKIIL